MNKSLLKTMSHEINLYILNLISSDRLNYIIIYLKNNPSMLLEHNELVGKKVNYMVNEREYGNNYGSSMEYTIYQANISTYENLLKIFLETPELKKQAVELLSDKNVLSTIMSSAIEQKNKELNNNYTTTSYSKFKQLEKLEDTRNTGEIEEVFNYPPQHAIKFILNNYKSFDNEIIEEILTLPMNSEKEVINLLQLTAITEITKLPKAILTQLKENYDFLNNKSLKMK